MEEQSQENESDILMKINDSRTNVGGTCYQGQINISYDKLVKILGEPLEGSEDGKTDAEWVLEDNGVVATIYNWKNGKAYDPEDGLDLEDITEWNIGGLSKMAVNLVEDYLK